MKVCLMIIVKKRKIQSLEQAYPTIYPEKQKYVHCTQRKIGHLFHDNLRDRKSEDFVKETSTYTFLVIDWIMNKFISGSTVKIF